MARDLLKSHRGERVHFRLDDGTQLSGVVIRVTRGEIELGSVRLVAGDVWQGAEPGSVLGFDRLSITYWQRLYPATEPG